MVNDFILVAVWLTVAAFFFALNIRSGSPFGKRLSYSLMWIASALAVVLAVNTTLEHIQWLS